MYAWKSMPVNEQRRIDDIAEEMNSKLVYAGDGNWR